ncbi:hypothetical protein PFISCL1PPCAC_4644, partial [Pristionchus fissidentatus]
MTRIASRLLISLIFVIFLYDSVESKRGGSIFSRGSSVSRSSSRSGGGGWFGGGWFGGSSSRSSSSSSSSSWGSRSHGSSGSGHRTYSSGSSNRPWSARYYGSTYMVWRPHTYYRGGGSTLVHSPYAQGSNNGNDLYGESPTITNTIIRDTLFIGFEQHPSPVIFKTKLKSKTREQHRSEFFNNFFKELNKNSLESQLAGREEIIYLTQPDLPVLVGSSINYFWGEANLPHGDNETDCFEFSPVNDNSNFTLCNVTSMTRCNKSTSDVFKMTKPGLFKYIKEERYQCLSVRYQCDFRVDQLAWLCPESKTCCEWECCVTEMKEHTEFDPPDESFVSMVEMFFILGSLMVIVIIGVCIYQHKERTARKA